MAYGLLYISAMRSSSRLCRRASLLGLALLLSGCGGRAISKRLARDVIIGSPAGELAKGDVEVLSITEVGAHDAIAETYLHTSFHLEKVGSDWVIREVRVGNGQWQKLEDVQRALQQARIDETRRMLDKIAAAIEAYRQKNGRLPDFIDYIALSDALSPLYLSPLIREDAWNHALAAVRLSQDTIRLVSAGPDGKPGTADDIELTRTFPR
jgi:hypothetical protein